MTEKIETPQEEMPELMPDPINFTDAAVAKVKELMDEEGFKAVFIGSGAGHPKFM